MDNLLTGFLRNFSSLLILVYIKTVAAGKRAYDKQNSCSFCEKEFSKVARHMQQVHGKEPEVKKAIAHKKKDGNKNIKFEKLCRMDNFNHNMKVLKIK